MNELDSKNNFFTEVLKVEKRLGYCLPKDYVSFLYQQINNNHSNDMWFKLNELELANQYDIVEYYLLEEMPELLNLEDCDHIIPILSDNNSYIVMDLIPNGKGVFIIWSNEVEIGLQAYNFTQFCMLLKNHDDRSKLTGNGMIFDYLS